jgi:hypothetical protein
MRDRFLTMSHLLGTGGLLVAWERPARAWLICINCVWRKTRDQTRLRDHRRRGDGAC